MKMFRKGTEEDFVVNGGFDEPNVRHRATKLYNQIIGWKGKVFEIGPGTSYNAKWGSTQVLELDAYRNTGVSQFFNFDANYDIGKLDYALEFLWSGRTTGPKYLNSHTGRLVWNDEELEKLVPPNTDIQRAYHDVELREGYNFLQFQGTGGSDGYGMVIDKLTLKSATDVDIIVNGEFDDPKAEEYKFVNADKKFKGWNVVKAEIGDCRIYNTAWNKFGHNQCMELDSSSNQLYTQVIYLSPLEYRKLVNDNKGKLLHHKC